MANKIQVKRSAVPAKVPTTTDLDLGEIGINTYDGKMYIKQDNGTPAIIQIGAGGSGTGDVTGPGSSTDNALARFDSTTGKIIQNSIGILDDSGNLTGINSITDPDYVTFNTGYATGLTTGQLGWDSTNNSLAFGMAGGNIVQHIGEDQYLYIKASATITKGQVIMFTGSVGASGVLTGAPATGITDGTYIIGIAAEAIANNAFGFVQTFGVLTNVNTSAFADADILWYDPSVTGGLTATKPSAPNVKAQVASCNKGGSAGGGVITVRVNPGSQLGGTDSNVQFGTLASGQTIIYDATAGYWKNSTLTAGTGISISNGAGSITVTNSAPDQTVAISGTSPVSVTGTYPTFTVSMTQSSGSANGWLSSTDWTTFNGKQAAYTNLTTIGSLANGAGWLYNNGSGTFSYSTPTASDVGAVPTARTLTINGTSFNLTANRTWSVGTVTSVAALTLGTTGTDLSSSVATGTTTPVITLNVPTASATNRGALSAADWTTFNNKGNGTVTSVGGTGTVAGLTLTGTVTGSGNLTLGGNLSITADMIYDNFTATAGQTTFTPSQTYTSGKIQVLVNGVMMINGADVTVTSGTSVVMAFALSLNDRVTLIYPI